MVEKFRLVQKAIHTANDIAFKCAAVLLLFMGLAVSYDVIMRYFFGSPTIWVNEVSGYLLVIITFLSASYTLRVGGHVRVDILENFLSETGKKMLFILAHLMILFFVIVITWQGAKMAWMAWSFDWRASTLLSTPLFIPQLFIPLGGFLLTLETLSLLIEKLIEGNAKGGATR